MKNETKTVAATWESTQQDLKKPRPSKHAGWLLPALLAAALTLLTACPTEPETKEIIKEVEVPGPEIPVPTYPEITIPVRLFGETMNVVCPGNLMGESYTKLNGAMIEIEGTLPEGGTKNRIINLLSNKTVTIEVKNDDSFSAAVKAEDSYAVSVTYGRVQNSDETIGILTMTDEILSALSGLGDRYKDETP
jgi:hypothetical protein